MSKLFFPYRASLKKPVANVNMPKETMTDVQSPMIAPSGLQNTLMNDNSNCEKFQMRKEIGLLEGVAIIIGIILGSGKIVR